MQLFTIGIALIGVRPGIGGNAIISANALTDYSYVNARDGSPGGVQIARCATGLGPGATNDNSDLGGVYFNGYEIPFAQCSDNFSAIIQPRPAIDLNNLGVIDILQCSRALTTALQRVFTHV